LLAQSGGDSFSNLRSQINRVFDDIWGESWLEPRREAAAGFWPQVDVTETDKEIKVCAEIPGVDPKDVEVRVEDGVLKLILPKRRGTESRRKKIPVS
jgi:HSP20 family protein